MQPVGRGVGNSQPSWVSKTVGGDRVLWGGDIKETKRSGRQAGGSGKGSSGQSLGSRVTQTPRQLSEIKPSNSKATPALRQGSRQESGAK